MSKLKFYSNLLFCFICQSLWMMKSINFVMKLIYNQKSILNMILTIGLYVVLITILAWIFGAVSEKLHKKHLILIQFFLALLIQIGLYHKAYHSILMTFSIIFFLITTISSYNNWIKDDIDSLKRTKIECFNMLVFLFTCTLLISLNASINYQLLLYIFNIFLFSVCLLEWVIYDERRNEKNSSLKQRLTYCMNKIIIENNRMFYCLLLALTIIMSMMFVFLSLTLLNNMNKIHLVAFLFLVILSFIFSIILIKIYELQGLKLSITISSWILFIGYFLNILFMKRNVGFDLVCMFGLFSTTILLIIELRNRLPENSWGRFQGLTMMCFLVIPTLFAGISVYLNDWVFILLILLGGCYLYVLKDIFHRIEQDHYDLMSEDAEKFLESEELPWQLHPHPQLKRDEIMMLNGKWMLNGEEILVPFPPESNLSGYKGKFKEDLTYQKVFVLPEWFNKKRVLLHFEAVDQICEVFLNGISVGHHEGGYLPFTFDITDYIHLKDENILQVVVKDQISPEYPYGKQTKKRGGMWYTPVSGIWQSVWLENVCENYIETLRITPNLKGVSIQLSKNIQEFVVKVKTGEGRMRIFKFEGNKGTIQIQNPILWTCENPHLYPIVIYAGEDKVESYFALRTISIQTIHGMKRVVLNNKPIFMHALLDQGYYCDGIYLPATEKEYEKDILRMKELGFNMLRKHIKVEPEYFYYACDKLGMLVMQDFVNNGSYNFIFDTVIPTYITKKRNDSKCLLKSKTHQIFIEHSKQLVEHLYNHPSIIAYTIFNEGWGQFHSDYVYDLVKKWDYTRLIDSTSGWFWQKKNDFDSEHIYFKEIDIQVKKRPYFVSECGGFTMLINNHIYSKYNTYGYGACENSYVLTHKICAMYEKMIIPAISKGVCGCVYTQLSDVEDEINGLYTYDRKVCKVIKEDMLALSKRINDEIKS